LLFTLIAVCLARQNGKWVTEIQLGKTGAILGKPLKRKVTPEETREQKKQYEKV
jgi:hypothetical protein